MDQADLVCQQHKSIQMGPKQDGLTRILIPSNKDI